MNYVANKILEKSKRLKRNILSEAKQLRGQLFLDLNRDHKNTIMLVGDGRSGTTWISNIINHRNEFRYMFEPFHPTFVKSAKGFRFYQYLRPTDKEPYFLNTARSILTGQLRNKRVDQYNRRPLYKKRLVKDIFAHLYLKWITEQFPGVRVILLLRHPCAVAISKLKLKKSWNGLESPKEFLAKKELVEDYIHPFIEDIKASNSLFEQQIFIWCITHYVILKQFRDGQIHLAFYENFCIRPKEEIRKLFSFIEKDSKGAVSDKVISQILKQPSQTTQISSAILLGENLIDQWRSNITDEQMDRAVQILKKFQLDTIYSYESLPNVAGAYNLLRKS